MNDKIKELGELNIAFYELFCKYDNYKDKLSEPMAKYMAEKLFNTYKLEFERIFSEDYIFTEYTLKRAREKYETDERRGALLPKRFRWLSRVLLRRRSRAAELIEEQVEQETEKFFAECEKKLAAEREQAEPHAETVSASAVKERGQTSKPANVADDQSERRAENAQPAPQNTENGDLYFSASRDRPGKKPRNKGGRKSDYL